MRSKNLVPLTLLVSMLASASPAYAWPSWTGIKQAVTSIWTRGESVEQGAARGAERSGARAAARDGAQSAVKTEAEHAAAQAPTEAAVEAALRGGPRLSLKSLIAYVGDGLEEKTKGFLLNTKKRVADELYGKTEGRDEAVEAAMRAMLSRESNGITVEGASKVGKSHIAYGLQEKILSGRVPTDLLDGQVITVNLSHPSAADGNLFLAMLDEIPKQDKEGMLILHLTNVEEYLGREANDQATNKLDTMMAEIKNKFRGRQVKFIVEMDTPVATLAKKANPALKKFPKIVLKPLNQARVFQIAKAYARGIYDDRGALISDSVVQKAIEIAERFYADMAPPYSVIRLLDDAAVLKSIINVSDESAYSAELREKLSELQHKLARAKSLRGKEARFQARELPKEIAAVETAIKKIDANLEIVRKAQQELAKLKTDNPKVFANPNGRVPANIAEKIKELNARIMTVGEQDLAFLVHREIGLPVEDVLGHPELTVDIARRMLTKIIQGQEYAVDQLVEVAMRAKAAVRLDEDAPLGVGILSGVPGSGKTSGAEGIAKVAFGGRIVRTNFAEFMEAHSISRIGGAQPGYLGYGEGDIVEELINTCQPDCVWLLDEFDRGHQKVLEYLINALGEGQLTNSRGQTMKLGRVMIIGTTNAVQGAPSSATLETIKTLLLRSTGMPRAIMDRVEFVVQFNKMTDEVAGIIFDKYVSDFNKKLANRFMKIRVFPGAKLEFNKMYRNAVRQAEAAAKAQGVEAALDVTARGIKTNFKRNIEDRLNGILSTGRYTRRDGRQVDLAIHDGDEIFVIAAERGEIVFKVAQ